jgi:hypothetical protein
MAPARVLLTVIGSSRHPVYSGFFRDVIRGCATTKCVEATIALTSEIGFPWSKALAAGVTRARKRIQAA